MLVLGLSTLQHCLEWYILSTDFGQGRQGVDKMLVLENSVAQRRHHDAYCPACVALQLDNLIRAAQSHTFFTPVNEAKHICLAPYVANEL